MILTRTGESLLPPDCQVLMVGVQVVGRGRCLLLLVLIKPVEDTLDPRHVISSEGIFLAWSWSLQQRSSWHVQNAVWLLP